MSFSQNIKDEILNLISKKKLSKKYMDAERFGEYLTQIEEKEEILNLEKDFGRFLKIEKLSENEIRYILRGVYLSSGCVVDPNYDYHFEIILKNKICKNYLLKLLEVLDFTPKDIKRKISSGYSYIIYIKDSEQISKFLSLIEASLSKLQFEQVRVEKNVKNNINRTVNCETANLVKTISTAQRQIDAIENIKKNNSFNKLDDKLKYVAELRIENPEASLEKLSEISLKQNKLSKSGIKHRLDKIIDISDGINEVKNNE